MFQGGEFTSVFIAIDLKSYYASVECVHRGLDPLTTNLLVADESRTDKTMAQMNECSVVQEIKDILSEAQRHYQRLVVRD